MTDNGHGVIKNNPTDSGTADRASGRDTSGSPTGVAQKGWTGQALPATEQSGGESQEASGQMPVYGHRIVADGGQTIGDHLSFSISSRYRLVVLDALEDGPATPSTIAEEEDIGIAHVSRALGRLRDRDIVELIVSDDRKKGRLYDLTDIGADLLDRHGDVIERNRGDA